MNYTKAYNELLKHREAVKVLHQKKNDTEQKLAFEREQLAQLLEVLEKEKYDVDQLTKTSLKKIFSTIKGSLEKDYEKEHQEFLDAKLRYDEKQSFVVRLEEALERYAKEIREQEGQLVEEEDTLVSTFSEASELKKRIEDKKATWYRLQKEVEEALYAVGNTMACAEKAQNYYKKAKSWATYDTFFGGGILGDLLKYSNLDDAQDIMNLLQYESKRMVKECKDVDKEFRFSALEIGSTMKTFDIVFDNIFTDWTVRNQIKDIIASLDEYMGTLNQIYQQLQEKERMILKELEQLKF